MMKSSAFLRFLCPMAFLAAIIFTTSGALTVQAQIIDATGQTIEIEDSSSVVSVGGSVTEILYALGLEDRVIAVDATSLFPATATELPNVGYMRRLSAEPILAMAPSLVLAVEDAGPPAVLDQLREAGVQVVLVPDDPSPEGIADKIDLISGAMGVPAKGRALSAGVKNKLGNLERAVAATAKRPKVLFLLSIGNGGAPLAAGRETSAAAIIELSGGDNAIDAFEGYKVLSPEALVEAAPDVVLVTDRSLGLLGGAEAIRNGPEVSQTPAGRDGRILSMEDLLLLGFGPRTPEAAAQLAQKLHPGLDLSAVQK